MKEFLKETIKYLKNQTSYIVEIQTILTITNIPSNLYRFYIINISNCFNSLNVNPLN